MIDYGDVCLPCGSERTLPLDDLSYVETKITDPTDPLAPKCSHYDMQFHFGALVNNFGIPDIWNGFAPCCLAMWHRCTHCGGLACSGCGNQRHKEYLTLPDVGPDLDTQLNAGLAVLCRVWECKTCVLVMCDVSMYDPLASK